MKFSSGNACFAEGIKCVLCDWDEECVDTTSYLSNKLNIHTLQFLLANSDVSEAIGWVFVNLLIFQCLTKIQLFISHTNKNNALTPFLLVLNIDIKTMQKNISAKIIS